LLDEIEDLAHLVDSRFLTADVLDVHAEVGVVGVDHRLADSGVDVERTKEQHEVGGQQEEDVDEIREPGHHGRGQRVEGIGGLKLEEVVGAHEVPDRQGGDEQGSTPEDGAVGLDGSSESVFLRGHALAEDQPPARHAEDAAAQQHRDHCKPQGRQEVVLQVDVREGKRRASDEQREDPEDDHGG